MSRLGLVRLVTRLAKVGQDWGQELDNFKFPALKSFLVVVVGWGGLVCLIIVSTPGLACSFFMKML